MSNTGGYMRVALRHSDGKPRTKPSKPAAFVTRDEFQAMLDTVTGLNAHDLRATVTLHLMYLCGLRRAEVVNLLVEEVIIDGPMPRIEVRESKYGASRNIPLDPSALPSIRAWLAMRPVEGRHFICSYKVVTAKNGISKGSPIGSKLHPNAVWQHVGTTKRRAGITRRIRPHMFRHGAATNWMNAKLPDGSRFTLRDIQYLLGHRNLQTTQKYLHVQDEEIARKVYQMPETVESTRQVAPEPVGPRVDPGYKSCEWCAEPIRAEARICRYCQRDQTAVA